LHDRRHKYGFNASGSNFLPFTRHGNASPG
jgi:hypothetical protein